MFRLAQTVFAREKGVENETFSSHRMSRTFRLLPLSVGCVRADTYHHWLLFPCIMRVLCSSCWCLSSFEYVIFQKRNLRERKYALSLSIHPRVFVWLWMFCIERETFLCSRVFSVKVMAIINIDDEEKNTDAHKLLVGFNEKKFAEWKRCFSFGHARIECFLLMCNYRESLVRLR